MLDLPSMTTRHSGGVRVPAVAAFCLSALGIASLGAQDRLRTMPGYDQYQRMQPQIAGSWVSGAVSPTWEADSSAFTYNVAGKAYRFDVTTLKAAETGDAPIGLTGRAGGRGAGGAGRGQTG